MIFYNTSLNETNSESLKSNFLFFLRFVNFNSKVSFLIKALSVY